MKGEVHRAGRHIIEVYPSRVFQKNGGLFCQWDDVYSLCPYLGSGKIKYCRAVPNLNLLELEAVSGANANCPHLLYRILAVSVDQHK